MKKIILFLALIFLLGSLYYCKQNEYIIVPEESIRFRIIPNSNSIEDIFIKEEVKQNIENQLISLSSDNIEKTRQNIQEEIPLIQEQIEETFKKNNYDKNFKIKYGLNYFPQKEYNGVLYKEGNYESLVVEIGEAQGSNFWCVLFPPLCVIETTQKDKIEYKFFIKEIIDKFTHK